VEERCGEGGGATERAIAGLREGTAGRGAQLEVRRGVGTEGTGGEARAEGQPLLRQGLEVAQRAVGRLDVEPEADLADGRLPEVGVHARGPLRPRDPQTTVREDCLGQHGQSLLERGSGREERHDNVAVTPQTMNDTSTARQLAQDLRKSRRLAQNRDGVTFVDAQFLRPQRAGLPRQPRLGHHPLRINQRTVL